jgi:4-amino-4-deoxy-L-arabinose transferase-like glycosyltransferase
MKPDPSQKHGPAAADRFHERATLTLILAFLVIRLVWAAWLPLIADEAYGVVVSRYPSLSYFDHPPLAFGFARAVAWLLGSEAVFVVRLPHVLMGALTAWMLFLVTRRAFDAAAGFWAVGAYSVAPFFLGSAGAFVVPDGPLNLFGLTALWLVLPALLGDDPMPMRRWLAAGLAFGLALLSKYTAFLFGASVLTLLLLSPSGRRELARPGPWLAGLVALACLAPVVVWNWQNGWVSFTFQSDRAATGGFNPLNFLLIQLGQAAYLLPWTWALSLVLVMRGLFAGDARRVFAAFAAPPILIFGAIGFATSEPLAHWAMPGYLFAFPLVGRWCADAGWPRMRRGVLAGSALFSAAIALAVAVQANSAGVTRALGIAVERDFDWTFLSWSALRDDFAARGILADPQAFIVSTSWNTGGKSAHAVGAEMPAAAPLFDQRHFALAPDPRLAGRTKGYLVEPAWPAEADGALAFLREQAAQRFTEAGEPWVVTQTRGGTPAFAIVVLPVTPR